MKNDFFLSMLIVILVFGFFSCDLNSNPNGDDEFTVTFDLDGGNISGNTASVEIKVKSGGTTSSLPNPQKGIDIFGGWFTQKNGAGSVFTSSTIVTSNITVYAKWTINTINQSILGKWVYIKNISEYDGNISFEFLYNGQGEYRYEELSQDNPPQPQNMTFFYTISGSFIVLDFGSNNIENVEFTLVNNTLTLKNIMKILQDDGEYTYHDLILEREK